MSTGSNDANRVTPAEKKELARLSRAVHELLEQWDNYRERARAAEARADEMERTLRDMSAGTVDPLTLSKRVQTLEQENRFLARRLDRARESVKRISARLQFLDEDR